MILDNGLIETTSAQRAARAKREMLQRADRAKRLASVRPDPVNAANRLRLRETETARLLENRNRPKLDAELIADRKARIAALRRQNLSVASIVGITGFAESYVLRVMRALGSEITEPYVALATGSGPMKRAKRGGF